MKALLRGLWDVNRFTLGTVSPPNILLTAISAVVMVGGVVFWVNDFESKAWVGVIVGLIGLMKNFVSLMFRWVTAPDMILKADDRLPQLLSDLHLTRDYLDAGYEKTEIPSHPNEYVVRSTLVDGFLRTNDLEAREDQVPIERINESLKRRADVLEKALRCQFRHSWRAYPSRSFINEKKTCLGSDLFPHSKTINIYRGTYFHSFLTNELSTYVLESRGPSPQIVYRGSDYFPQYSDGAHLLKRTGESLMGNHIGISTIVHTSDGQLVLWRQSGGAQQSRDLLASTGSGSCDWQDWVGLPGSRSLKNLIKQAMEREFREESHPLSSKLNDVVIRTEPLGFFRWVRRGGKPEFVGISKIAAPLDKLVPNPIEVDAPEFMRHSYPATSIKQLQQAIEELLNDSSRLSVPLWVNLVCLGEALRSEPDQWADFLAIE